MTLEWRHVVPNLVGSRGGRESSQVQMQIELIGYEENMQIECGYQTAILDFWIFRNFGNLVKYSFLIFILLLEKEYMQKNAC